MEQFFVSLDKLARESHLTVAYTPKDLDQFKVYTAEVYRPGIMPVSYTHLFNMFVMKKELLQHYCTWLFDILFELEKELDISSYSTNDKRVFGFVSERLLDAWLITNNIAYEELDVVYMESQHWLRKGMAFLNRKFFPHKEAHK